MARDMVFNLNTILTEPLLRSIQTGDRPRDERDSSSSSAFYARPVLECFSAPNLLRCGYKRGSIKTPLVPNMPYRGVWEGAMGYTYSITKRIKQQGLWRSEKGPWVDHGTTAAATHGHTSGALKDLPIHERTGWMTHGRLDYLLNTRGVVHSLGGNAHPSYSVVGVVRDNG